MEGLRLQYDGSIRSPSGELVQLLYGEDGLDGAFVEAQKLAILTV
jgi:DNA-directed RNA polymerase II subunit RPB1